MNKYAGSNRFSSQGIWDKKKRKVNTKLKNLPGFCGRHRLSVPITLPPAPWDSEEIKEKEIHND